MLCPMLIINREQKGGSLIGSNANGKRDTKDIKTNTYQLQIVLRRLKEKNLVL